MAHFEMRPFSTAEAEMIALWARTPDDLRHLEPGVEFPLTADQIAAWVFQANFAFTLRRDGDLVAYGEILEDEVAGDVEIQHVLVAPDVRHSGIGKALVSRLCAFLAAARPYPDVWLRAGRDNPTIACCARALGFAEVPEMSGERFLWLQKALHEL